MGISAIKNAANKTGDNTVHNAASPFFQPSYFHVPTTHKTLPQRNVRATPAAISCSMLAVTALDSIWYPLISSKGRYVAMLMGVLDPIPLGSDRNELHARPIFRACL